MITTCRELLKYCGNKLGYQTIARCSSKAIENVQNRVSVTSQPSYGQPTWQTHPHLLNKGEIIPGISLEELKTRRSKLAEKILSFGYDNQKDSFPQIVVLPSASKVHISDEIPYVFRQNTDFLYFTGCQEPDSVLVLIVNESNFTTTLFVRPKDQYAELWDGPRTGVEASTSFFGVDQVLPVSEFERYFVSFISENKKSTIWYNNTDSVQSKFYKTMNQLIKLTDKQIFLCPKLPIHQLRIIKSEAEINLMKKSCEIASGAIAKTMELSKPGMSEHQLFAIVDYESRMNGAEFLAYPPVVAAGKNANTIHYISNNQMIKEGEMVLMDAGCEYHGYTSDITRTWPISGSFTTEQRLLYEIVLDVQTTLIRRLSEKPTLDQLYRDMCFLLGKRLQEINLLPKSLEGQKLSTAACTYCPHHIGHYLGMDVHDSGKISRGIRVQPGMVVTIEPGIYVNPNNQYAPPNFHNIGIRIEDDILICNSDYVTLTKDCPKEIPDIEALVQKTQI